MRIAYHSNDEVNKDRLQGMADTFGIYLSLLDLRDNLSAITESGLLIDLDSWPFADRDTILGFLVRWSCPCPVAIHSYNLNGSTAPALRCRGIPIVRRLSPAVFEALCHRAGLDAA